MLTCMMVLSAVPAFAQTGGNTAQDAVVLPEGITWEEGKTVYYNGQYYDTLVNALKAVFMSNPGEKTAEVYCKPNADVGTMTHGHVADDIIIYGNNAKVTGGEHDLEVDTYKYSRETGIQSNDGEYLVKDIKILVKNLDGIAVWGQRNTEHKIDVTFENCENINRMYITGTSGEVNYNVSDCTFDVSKGSHKNTSIYTNAPGTLNLDNVLFKGVALAINQNNKSNGTQIINVKNCVFEDCAEEKLAEELGAKTFAAPIRIVAQDNAKSVLNLNNSEFRYSDGFKRISNNGDVLLGDGRHDKAANGLCQFNAKNNSPFELCIHEAGYYDGSGKVTDPSKAKMLTVDKGDDVITDGSGEITVDDHSKTVLKGEKEATCKEEGYTGDTVCEICGKILKEGKVSPKTAHSYKDGKCTVCGEKQSVTEKPESPQTGDATNVAYLAMMLVAAVAIMAVALRKKYNK